MLSFKEKCIALRKSGLTISEIVKATGRPKTSIYFHISSLPLSKDRLIEIKKAAGMRAKKIALARKGKSVREFKEFNEWDKTSVSLVSHLLFDGSITNSSCIYNNRNLPLIKLVENSMKAIYDFEPNRWRNLVTGVYRISYHNVALSKYLKEKVNLLTKDILFLPRELKKEFIKSFFDDEGCVDFRPQRNLRQIRGYQKDISILHLIVRLLQDFDISSRVVKPNEVVISGKENLKKYETEIGFSQGVKRNENRSNSIWKRPLEKNLLLRQAISSFRN